jgi:MFS family permease
VTPARALTLQSISLLLSMTTWLSASAVIPQLRAEWDISASASAWLTIAVQLGFVAGALISSLTNLSDVLRPTKVILGGSLGAAAANLLLLVASSVAPAILLRFLTGMCLAAVYPPSLKLSSTWFQKGRGLALGILVGSLTIGTAAPHLVNGLGGLEWQTVIWATSALTVIGGLIAGFLVDEGPYPFPQARFDPGQAGQVFSNRAVRLASLGYFGHMWELYAMWAWFFLFFSEAVLGGRGEPAAFATFAVIGIGGLGCWAGGVLGDRWGRAQTTSLMMATSGLCALVIGLFAEGPEGIVLVVGLIWGFAVVADSAQFSAIVTEVADQAYVGTALTLQLALGFTLTVATIWLIPILEGRFGWRWAFAFLAAGPVVGIAAMARLRALQVSQVAQSSAGGLTEKRPLRSA